ncbi:hypothetical protein Acr_23g0010950 [Actinidia rufa]|uniref:Uncharacterized protein n=1 Tax=Actinidia rufa TaxID=165716 RepID=A0A7J0GPG8_9ERIC|nr:hypothetical protein Acr_23g0010950 [Actinidia rufa]
MEDIQVIHRGFGSRGCSSPSRQRHVREAHRQAEEEVYNLSTLVAGVHQPIIFTNDDLRVQIDDAEMEALRDEVEEITFADPRETKNTKPLEVVAPISIHPDHPDCHVMIGTELTEEQRNALVEFLKKNYNVFAWSQGNVLGIGPQVAVHKLFTNTILQFDRRDESSLRNA